MMTRNLLCCCYLALLSSSCLPSSIMAFIQQQYHLHRPSAAASDSNIIRDSRLYRRGLYVDGNNGEGGGGGGEYSKENLDPSKSKISQENANNEWGIPNSKTLVPFDSGKKPLSQLKNGGKVSLIGSGPGDPDLLTVKAYQMLQNPNALIISDRLVSQEILDLIKGEVKVARKLPGCAELAQEEIYWWCYQGLSQGKHVIRLKIGDPFVFGRGGEEILQFRNYGIEPEVVPGVSAAFSAPLLANIPVTHRGVANQVVMCTGYGREGTSPDLIQYHKEQTIVFLMAVGRLRELSERLVRLAGYPKDTPVAIVEKAGTPSQRTVVGNMETIADLSDKYNVQAPSTIVVGGVVNVLLENDEGGEEAVTGLIQNSTQVMFSS